MLEDLRRGNEDEARRQREAAEKAARERAQASLAQLSMQSQGSQGSQGSWPQQPQNYPPAPSWQQASRPDAAVGYLICYAKGAGNSPAAGDLFTAPTSLDSFVSVLKYQYLYSTHLLQ